MKIFTVGGLKAQGEVEPAPFNLSLGSG